MRVLTTFSDKQAAHRIVAFLALNATETTLEEEDDTGEWVIWLHDDDQRASAEEMVAVFRACLLYTSPSPRDLSTSRMPSSA